MTSHKPFTAEELDELAKVEPHGEYPDSCLVDMGDYADLIAQAREANRLRDSDVVLSALAFLAGCFGVGYRVEEIFRLARERGWETDAIFEEHGESANKAARKP